jgi:hypothetical protein
MFVLCGSPYCARCKEELEALKDRATTHVAEYSIVYEDADNRLIHNYLEPYRFHKSETKAPMTQPEYLAHAKETCDQIQKIIKAKSSDYANEQDALANFRGASEFGVSDLVGLLLRMNDKFQRAKAYARRGDLKVEGEGIEDVFMDLIGYSIAALALLKSDSQN